MFTYSFANGARALVRNRSLGPRRLCCSAEPSISQGSGHAWQGRFYSVPVPTDRVWTVLRYIELNPVRAGLAFTAGGFPWSTAQYHLGISRKLECLSVSDWLHDWCSAQWAEALATGVRGEEELLIRRATKIGDWSKAIATAGDFPIGH